MSKPGLPKSKSTNIGIVEWNGMKFPIRVIDTEEMFKDPPKEVMRAIAHQSSDFNNLLWVGMSAIAEDIYSRQPEGSRKFQEFVSKVGLQLVDINGKKIVVEEELKKH